MRNLSRPLAITLMAATIPATIVFAEQPPAGDQAAFQKHRPSPETLARLEEGRIAFAKAALRLTPDQEKLWAPVEEKIRANFEARRKARADWQAKIEERKAKGEESKAKGDDVKREKLALPERIEKRSERMTKMAKYLDERAAKTKEFAEALKPLYASFSDEQQAVAGSVLGHFFGKGGPGPHGPRWAMHRGFGYGHGPQGPGPGRAPDAK
jgi:hypothetical protein